MVALICNLLLFILSFMYFCLLISVLFITVFYYLIFIIYYDQIIGQLSL